MAGSDREEQKWVARNKRARYKYEILERVEAGIVLLGTEVKSLRAGRVALADAFGRFKKGELWLMNCHISPYEMGSWTNHEPTRPRKLLLTRRQLRRLWSKVEERGLTVVPLGIYFTRGLAKVDLGLVRGKRQRDRRENLRKRDAEREIRRSYG